MVNQKLMNERRMMIRGMMNLVLIVMAVAAGVAAGKLSESSLTQIEPPKTQPKTQSKTQSEQQMGVPTCGSILPFG